MSKSIPMLPSLAGGSGVAAHALVDTDLMWVVDAETLDADRDRKATLAELGVKFRDQTHIVRYSAIATIASVNQATDQILATVSVASLPAGTWELYGWVEVRPASSSGPSIPRDGNCILKCGSTVVATQPFELDQKRSDYGGATVYRSSAIVQVNPVIYDNTSVSTSFSLTLNASVQTSGGDTYKVQDGVFIARRVWLS